MLHLGFKMCTLYELLKAAMLMVSHCFSVEYYDVCSGLASSNNFSLWLSWFNHGARMDLLFEMVFLGPFKKYQAKIVT